MLSAQPLEARETQMVTDEPASDATSQCSGCGCDRLRILEMARHREGSLHSVRERFQLTQMSQNLLGLSDRTLASHVREGDT